MVEANRSERPHEPRLASALRELLRAQRVATLACLDGQNHPALSMVPFACCTQERCLVIHVSALAAHTRYMMDRPDVGLMVCEAEVAGQPVHALQRVSIQGLAEPLRRDSAAWLACRAAYLARFEEARPMTELGDFSFFKITPQSGRHIAGFGAARSVDADELHALVAS
jgi:putative heme iron utilization protein